MKLDLSGKRAIVTGGGRGLCRCIAEALHDSGAEVVLVGSSEATKKLQKKCRLQVRQSMQLPVIWEKRMR